MYKNIKPIGKALSQLVRRVESPIEQIILEELLNYDVPFETQYSVGAYRLDFAFPEYKVALEVDGWEYHNSDKQKARDELRDEYLREVEGWTVERIPAWFCRRLPHGAVLKALRHIPEATKDPRYKFGEGAMKSWYIADQFNNGDREEALRIIEEEGEE